MHATSDTSSSRAGWLRPGPLLVTTGLTFTLPGMINFLATFDLIQPARFAWCCWIGMPLLVLGLVCCEVERLRGHSAA